MTETTSESGYGFGGSTSGVQRDCAHRPVWAAAADLPDQQRVHHEPDPGGAVRPAPEERGGVEPANHDGVCVDGYTAPVTRSPLDPWHSEEYLVRCLVKMHGWRWREPRVLAGPFRKLVKSFMNPEGE